MRAFTAQEWVTITGRGRVALIAGLPEGDHVYDPRTFKGWRVRIDSQEYDVAGVEATFGYVPSPSRPYRGAFGLLVRVVSAPACPECHGTGEVWTDPHVCTCGTGPSGYYGMHEPGCGAEPCPAGCPYTPPALTEEG